MLLLCCGLLQIDHLHSKAQCLQESVAALQSSHAAQQAAAAAEQGGARAAEEAEDWLVRARRHEAHADDLQLQHSIMLQMGKQ